MVVHKAVGRFAVKQKIDFKYYFEITGFEKVSGTGSIIIDSKTWTQESIKKSINKFVLAQVNEFLVNKNITQTSNFGVDTGIEILAVHEPTIAQRLTEHGGKAQVTSQKYIVFIVGLAIVIMSFLVLCMNHYSFAFNSFK
ncbi:hypothetical protein [Alkanindiges illinoisensis]|uniref:hypothetical protein n=1 Tax=Alkanindiges illinoisensis TaxID=197183 RepID=UPI0004798019|nr:hypothetical protein [Alkanindiges illinoisensis]